MTLQPVVAITGGTRGIGIGIRDIFLSHGYAVAVCSRQVPESLPRGVLHCAADVRNREQLTDFVKKTVDRFHSLDVFVNNAGLSRWRPLESIDSSFVDEIVKTSLEGTLWGCRAAAAAMKDGGAIVNVSSLAGKRGSANNSVYCAAKFAVNGITQSIAKELGPRNIRVNAVCPVYVDTAKIREGLQEASGPVRSESVDKYLSDFAMTQTALRRLPTIMEVAEVVYFLGSAAASAVTGQCLNVDCGTLPQ